MSIIIFSKPIHSGKTTALMQWCKEQKNIQGILMSDVDGQRMIFNIATQEFFIIQCKDVNTSKEIISIGKYHFYADAFEKANTILLKALTKNPGWLIIDEIGKLELQQKGFYESAKKIIDYYIINYCKKENKNLLLVVRDSLVEEVVEFFGISEFSLIDKL